MQFNILLSREEGYIEKYEEIYNSEAPERLLIDYGIRGLKYGIHGGGKWNFKDHYKIELAASFSKEKELGKGSMKNITLYIDFYIKLGYRF